MYLRFAPPSGIYATYMNHIRLMSYMPHISITYEFRPIRYLLHWHLICHMSYLLLILCNTCTHTHTYTYNRSIWVTYVTVYIYATCSIDIYAPYVSNAICVAYIVHLCSKQVANVVHICTIYETCMIHTWNIYDACMLHMRAIYSGICGNTYVIYVCMS